MEIRQFKLGGIQMSIEDHEIMAEAPREEAAARAEHDQLTAEVS